MKSLRNSFILFTILLSAVSCSKPQTEETETLISVSQFEEKIKEDKSIVILDVRTPGEFSEGYIAGAINKDYMNENFLNEIESLDKQKTYVVYCQGGGRQKNAADQLKSLGFENIYLLEGGFNAWQEQSKPIEK